MVAPGKDLARIFRAAIRAVDAQKAVHGCLRTDGSRLEVFEHGRCIAGLNLNDFRHIYVVGAGKAGAAMAKAAETIIGERIDDGVVVVKYGHGETLSRVRVVEAGHPVPDENGMAGAKAVLDLAFKATSQDLILCLISGGGSALMPLPPEPVTLAEKQAVTRQLLESGADIREINCIRKHLSRIKGGHLAAAAKPARVVAIVISDVVGDPLDAIASGPLSPDPTTFDQARDILCAYGLWERIPPSVSRFIESGIKGTVAETPGPDDDRFQHITHAVAAANFTALQAAKAAAEALGYTGLILSSRIEGDTAQAAAFHAAVAKEIKATGHPVPVPACMISGGETTVRVKGKGKGGRNMEFALRAAPLIDGCSGILAASLGTDGTDGPTDAAGALADHTTLERARAKGLDIGYHMDNNDAYPFFEALGDLIITGPTRTNVMDLRIWLVT